MSASHITSWAKTLKATSQEQHQTEFIRALDILIGLTDPTGHVCCCTNCEHSIINHRPTQPYECINEDCTCPGFTLSIVQQTI